MSTSLLLQQKMTEYSALVEDYMKQLTDRFYEKSEFSRYKEAVSPLFDSFTYSLFAGGKRLRPFLALEFCKVCGAEPAAALPYAAAIEMIHTFSLIHDDLPCMDDDDLRRGKPTNHKVFGEACAVLAGDALSLYAFETASNAPHAPETNLRAIRLLAGGAGVCGMIAGQQIDMWAETHEADASLLSLLQQKKTGALFETACLLGCTAAGIDENDQRYDAAKRYAAHIGLAFQMTDDILDVCGDDATLGKHTGSDAQNGKTTFVTLLGLDGAAKAAGEQISFAKQALAPFHTDISLLEALADFILERNN